MVIDPHHRRSLRLQGYDYSQNGAYFITIVTQGRRCFFGKVVHGEMVLNAVGKMVEQVWLEIPGHYPGIHIETFVVMPNHIHGLIMIDDHVEAPPCGCPSQPGQARGPAPTTSIPGQSQPLQQGPAPTKKQLSLPDVVHDYKSLTTHRYMIGVHEHQWQPFASRLWQRNYYSPHSQNPFGGAKLRISFVMRRTTWRSMITLFPTR